MNAQISNAGIQVMQITKRAHQTALFAVTLVTFFLISPHASAVPILDDIQRLETIESSLDSNFELLIGDIANERLNAGLTGTLDGYLTDINAFVLAVLRESFLLQNEVLQDLANKVDYFNDLKDSIRDALEDARSARAQAGASSDDCYVSPFFGASIILGQPLWNVANQICVEAVDPLLLASLSQPAFELSDFLSGEINVNSIITVNTILSEQRIPFQVVQVPEPDTLALLCIGLFGMGLSRRRKKI